MLPDLITAVPGPRSVALARRLRRHESHNVTFVSDGFPVFWDRADGVNVWDVDGNRYLDFTSAFGVASIGHNHPDIVHAARSQGELLLHGMGDVHPTEAKVDLCARLSALTFERWGLGPAKSILANSGFEAVEAALKSALMRTGRPRVLTFEDCYHGLGYGTLAAGSLPAFRKPFSSQLSDFGTMLPFPACDAALLRQTGTPAPEAGHDDNVPVARALEAVRKQLRQGDVGAILIEPLQGRGGKNLVHPAFLRALRSLCDESGALLIFDEILTGLNRTGKLFACEHFGVYPDIICLGKALTSGYPLSACVAAAPVMDSWPESTGEALHTSTFLGNPLGCKMALTSLDIHERPETGAQVARAGATLRALLSQLDSPRIGATRGLGLLLGLELIGTDGTPDPLLARSIVARSLRDGIFFLAESPAGNILSLVPPFPISTGEMEWACRRLQEYLVSLPGSIS